MKFITFKYFSVVTKIVKNFRMFLENFKISFRCLYYIMSRIKKKGGKMFIAKMVVSLFACTAFYLLAVYALVAVRIVSLDYDNRYIGLSVIFGTIVAALAILSIKGFIPFINGYHPPIWIISVFCLFSSLPFIDRIEIFGNIIVDAIFMGIISVFIVLFASSGFHELVSGKFSFILFKAWLILTPIISIITASIIRIFYY